MSDTPTLVMFDSGYAEDGIGDDGLPLYRETIMIQLDRPPLLSLRRVATEQDFDDYPEQFKLFTKQQANRKAIDTANGYPLSYWPVVTPSELKMCTDRDVVTVQQLAALSKRDLTKLPPQIVELSKRANEMIELTGKVGKFEKIINGLKGERDALAEQVKECNATISAQNALINNLKARVA